MSWQYFTSEWELGDKVGFDGSNKLITVYPSATALDIRADVWSAWVRWFSVLGRNYDSYLPAMERTGLDAIPGGQTGDTYFLVNGWRLIVDFSKVAVTGVLFSRDFNTAYYTGDLVSQFATQVSSIVNVSNTTSNVVTGDLSTVSTQVTAVQTTVDTIDGKVDTIPADVWEVSTASMTTTTSIGYLIFKKLLTVGKFLSLK